ncbi:hypothetical protein CHARACLAT_002097 [Characodon lateralis]|uniref:Uncharacterized protein n=1 Tax=Characodon lateralis TaxID=208331 RepID=A0ABU7DD92_9TELE|nr:hypothetical protein [Characodon lateralis]
MTYRAFIALPALDRVYSYRSDRVSINYDQAKAVVPLQIFRIKSRTPPSKFERHWQKDTDSQHQTSILSTEYVRTMNMVFLTEGINTVNEHIWKYVPNKKIERELYLLL